MCGRRWCLFTAACFSSSPGEELSAMRETWVQSLGWVDPWRRKWQSTLVFLPGELHGQRSLAGHSPCGRKKSDMIERLTHCLYLVDAHSTFPSVTIKNGSRFCYIFLRSQNHSLAENHCRKGLGYMMLRCWDGTTNNKYVWNKHLRWPNYTTLCRIPLKEDSDGQHLPLDGSHPLLQTKVLAHFPKGKEEIQNPLDVSITDTLCHTAETNVTL